MLDLDTINSVNFDAIHRIICGQGAGNEDEPFYKRKKQPTEEVMESLDLENDLSLAVCFPSLPARLEREGRKPFKIDLSSIDSMLDHAITEDCSTMKSAVHKDYNCLQDVNVFSAAANHQRTLLQKIKEQNSSNLPPREKNLPIQGSDREISGNASNEKVASNDKSTLSRDGKKLEEEKFTVDISTSYLGHVMESITQITKSEINFDVREHEHLQTSKGVLPKVLMLEESEHHIKLGNQVLQSEKGPQLDSRQQTIDVMPSDVSHSPQLKHSETHMIISDAHPFTNAIKGKGVNREPDQFQHKATQSLFPSLSVSLPSNISAAVMLLRKRKSESHSTAYNSYDPCEASIQQGAPETCSPLISLSQEAFETSQNFKQVEYAGQRSLSISSSSRSPMNEEIKDKESITNSLEVHLSNSQFPIKQQAIDNESKLQPESVRQNTENLSTGTHLIFGDNVNALNRDRKGRMMETLNRQDWQYAEGVGTLWTGGVRRSMRIQSRPLPNSTRQNKKNSTMSANRPLKKNESAVCGHQKGRMKEKINWQDWQYLEGVGTSWTSGLRRSTRIRSRPLEFWRGERFLYGRIYSCNEDELVGREQIDFSWDIFNCCYLIFGMYKPLQNQNYQLVPSLSTVIGIKYISPKPSMLRKNNHGTFKVQSYVGKKHSSIVKFAALH